MQEPTTPPKKATDAASRKKELEDRRNQERRQIKCEGFTYIPMVGWYCRRDQSRRNEDTNTESGDKEGE